MAQIEYNTYSNEIIIGLDKIIVFINSTTGQITKQINLPENLNKLIPITTTTIEDDEGKKLEDLSPIIQHIKISPNGKLLAVTTAGLKSLVVYQINEKNAEILSVRSISRVSSSITISPNSTKILICDKSGDCWLFDCSTNMSLPCKWLLGHLSIVYDIQFSPDEKYIITSDRDSKIRTTNYPNSHDIESYCLGHDEYVSGITILENAPHLLLSVSGDKFIKLWNWIKGIKLKEVILPAPGIKFCVRLIAKNTYEIVVLVYESKEAILVYELIIVNNEEYLFNLKSSKKLDSKIITNICYIASGGGLLVSIFNNKRLNIELLDFGGKLDIEFRENLKKLIENKFKDCEYPEPEDISGWFKKKYDNLANYRERKKQRIDAKQKK